MFSYLPAGEDLDREDGNNDHHTILPVMSRRKVNFGEEANVRTLRDLSDDLPVTQRYFSSFSSESGSIRLSNSPAAVKAIWLRQKVCLLSLGWVFRAKKES
jgi:hypothetical protein